MSHGSPSALVLLRVRRGQPAPAEPELRAAIARDRQRLHAPPPSAAGEFAVAGPYPITIDGQELDEYVVWER